MRKKRFLAAILLVVVFCFMSRVGYGEVQEWMFYEPESLMNFQLLHARVNYMMSNPDSFQQVDFLYDPIGDWRGIAGLPENINTKGKIIVIFFDRRGLFPKESGVLLLVHLEIALKTLYSFLDGLVATDMNSDIVATFHKTGGAFVGYFSEGEYHLWEE